MGSYSDLTHPLVLERIAIQRNAIYRTVRYPAVKTVHPGISRGRLREVDPRHGYCCTARLMITMGRTAETVADRDE